MKRILGWVVVAILAVAIPVVYATVVKDDMTFTGTVTMSGTETHSGAITNTSTVANTGVVTNSDGVIFNDEVAFEPYKHAVTSQGAATFTWLYSYGNIVIFSGATEVHVQLPVITVITSGYVLVVKNESGSTERRLRSYLGDGIEDTQGTMTANTEADIDAAGDVLTLMAMHSTHLAGASSVWMIVDSGIQ